MSKDILIYHSKFDGKQSLNCPSFSKISKISSNLFKFDGKDVNLAVFEKNNPILTKAESDNTRIFDNKTSDTSDISNIKNMEEILKSDPRIVCKNLFYYCKEHHTFKNIYKESIMDHLIEAWS